MAKKGKDVYVYFNNDIGGHAVDNALTLIAMIPDPFLAPYPRIPTQP